MSYAYTRWRPSWFVSASDETVFRTATNDATAEPSPAALRAIRRRFVLPIADKPPLSQPALDTINGILKGFGWAANPADVTGRANSDHFPAIMNAMIKYNTPWNPKIA